MTEIKGRNRIPSRLSPGVGGTTEMRIAKGKSRMPQNKDRSGCRPRTTGMRVGLWTSGRIRLEGRFGSR